MLFGMITLNVAVLIGDYLLEVTVAKCPESHYINKLIIIMIHLYAV